MSPQVPAEQVARAAAVRVAYDVTDYGNVGALLDVAEWVLTGQRPVELLPALDELVSVGMDAIDAKVRAGVADVLDVPQRTFVVANRQDAGRQWCRDNGVHPFGRDTRIISTADALHGCAIRPTDTVVFAGDVDAIADDVRFAVQLAQRAGGAL